MSSSNNKLIIYQLLPRLFGNTNTTNKYYGSVEENGVGKLNDINDAALYAIKAMGFTHVWYTGVIEHATMTDYSAYGIKPDDPDVVKGRAGSPYAIKDYYDIDPDLAIDVPNRVTEFEELVKRTHDNGLKVIIDFVPNHVSRCYKSDKKPQGVRDFGEDDHSNKAFDVNNDFYYMPGEYFEVPDGYNPGGDEFISPLKDGEFHEYPAKATGNDVFNAHPSINDWFETVKLNYGVDYSNGQRYFDPIPPLWNKLYRILHYWTQKGVDGFRCDMVEHVPFEFWGWLVPKLKAEVPGILFIGEAYDKNKYRDYIFKGKFDYLYDKSGLYDTLRRITTDPYNNSTWQINAIWNYDTNGIEEHMLRFMETHDEQRIASEFFAGDAWHAVPGMILTATFSTGPVMIYNGQEVGERADGCSGFSGYDGRSSIFDYCSLPEHQKWLNYGKFDGSGLTDDQKKLRNFYCTLLTVVQNNQALQTGEFYELMLANQNRGGFDERIYAYLRYNIDQQILIVVNFDRNGRDLQVCMPSDLADSLNLNGQKELTDLLTGAKYSTNDIKVGINIALPGMGGMILKF